MTAHLKLAALAAIAALAAACPAAGCASEVVTDALSSGCPATAPEVSSPCDHAGICAYADATCGALTCLDGVWQPVQGGCNPPPGPCPEHLPTAGAPCKSHGQACTFTFAGSCTGVFVATCGDAGQWEQTDESPPCMP